MILQWQITPPNWVNGFVDFEEYNELKSHKESLPLTIQRIIEYAQQQIGHNKLIKLNYDEIENDLKYINTINIMAMLQN